MSKPPTTGDSLRENAESVIAKLAKLPVNRNHVVASVEPARLAEAHKMLHKAAWRAGFVVMIDGELRQGKMYLFVFKVRNLVPLRPLL